mgnify:CR=1 FL=1
MKKTLATIASLGTLALNLCDNKELYQVNPSANEYKLQLYNPVIKKSSFQYDFNTLSALVVLSALTGAETIRRKRSGMRK